MQEKKVVVLPLLYRNCDSPLFLSDRRYADFRTDYQIGLRELAGSLGIEETETISADNWRRFTKTRDVDWKKYRTEEFERVVTAIVDRAVQYNWSTWVGAKSCPFSIRMSAYINRRKNSTVTIKLNTRGHAYMASLKDVFNPKDLKPTDFRIYVGNTVNECEEFVWRRMEDFKEKNGNPTEAARQMAHRFLSFNEQLELTKRMLKEFSWYKGCAPIEASGNRSPESQGA